MFLYAIHVCSSRVDICWTEEAKKREDAQRRGSLHVSASWATADGDGVQRINWKLFLNLGSKNFAAHFSISCLFVYSMGWYGVVVFQMIV